MMAALWGGHFFELAIILKSDSNYYYLLIFSKASLMTMAINFLRSLRNSL